MTQNWLPPPLLGTFKPLPPPKDTVWLSCNHFHHKHSWLASHLYSTRSLQEWWENLSTFYFFINPRFLVPSNGIHGQSWWWPSFEGRLKMMGAWAQHGGVIEFYLKIYSVAKLQNSPWTIKNHPPLTFNNTFENGGTHHLLFIHNS